MKRIRQLPELTTKAKVLIGVGVFVVVGAIGTFVVASVVSNQLRGDTENYDFAKKDTTTRQKSAVTAADDALKSGNSSKANDVYEQAIEAEPDPLRKIELAINQSRMLYGAGKFDEALEVAKKAESYSDDKFMIYDWTAQLYQVHKDYSDAAEYFEKAGQLADSPSNKGKYPKSFYDNQVKRMKELASKD